MLTNDLTRLAADQIIREMKREDCRFSFTITTPHVRVTYSYVGGEFIAFVQKTEGKIKTTETVTPSVAAVRSEIVAMLER